MSLATEKLGVRFERKEHAECIRTVQPAMQMSIHVAGQKRPSIVAGRPFIQLKAAVRPIAWIVTQSAIRH